MELVNYINGEWVKPAVKEYFDVINDSNTTRTRTIELYLFAGTLNLKA